MYTDRNRVGSRPGHPVSTKPHRDRSGPPDRGAPARPGPPPTVASDTSLPPFLLSRPAPAAFPADLILPPHRGAIITTAAWPVGLIPAPLPAMPPYRAPMVMPRLPATSPQGEPGRDTPGRRPSRPVPPRPGTRTARKAERRAAVAAELARREAAAAAMATGIGTATADAADESHVIECVVAVAPPVTLAVAPEPVASSPCPRVAPEPDAEAAARQTERPAERPAEALAPVVAGEAVAQVRWSAPDDRTPLPRHRAPVVARQGWLDVVAASVGDAGRFLARMMPGARRSRELKERVARAEARLRAMEAQLAALEALRERVQA